MNPSLQELLSRLDHLPNALLEIKDGVQKAVRIADEDPEMALTRSRKVLELVVREVYERRVNEPAGTRPLENLLQRLVKDGHFPDRLDAYATTVRRLGNVGTHTFGETVTAADVQQSLAQLVPILEWYAREERPGAPNQEPARQVEPAGAIPPHVHSREEEGFCVLEGEISILIGDERLVATAGTFANMPVGTPHSFKNESGKPARTLISVAPAGLERMFFECGVPLAEGPTTAPPPTKEDIDKLLAAAPRYGIDIRLPGH